MNKSCETCRHRRDFHVIGIEVFPSICKAPTAKKHEFGLRFTEVMRKDGWLKAWLFNTCGKRGRWWQAKQKHELPAPSRPAPPMPNIKPPKPEKGIDARDQWGFPPFYEEVGTITPQQWDALTKSIDQFKATKPVIRQPAPSKKDSKP